MTFHAFIDESARSGSYLLTAALIPSRDLAAISKQVRAVFPRGNRRTHLCDESPQRRNQLLKAYTTIPVASYVVVTSWPSGNDRPARQRCLGKILRQAHTWRVGMLVIDSRGEHRDRQDRQLIAREIREGRAPDALQYTHRGSRDEPLLCLPDAVGWAVGAGGRWRHLIEPVVRAVIEVAA